MSHVSEMETMADRLGLSFQKDIEDIRVDIALLKRLPLAFARNNLILPIREEDGRLIVALADPAKLPALDDVAGLFEMPVDGVVVPPANLLEAVNKAFTGGTE